MHSDNIEPCLVLHTQYSEVTVLAAKLSSANMGEGTVKQIMVYMLELNHYDGFLLVVWLTFSWLQLWIIQLPGVISKVE